MQYISYMQYIFCTSSKFLDFEMRAQASCARGVGVQLEVLLVQVGFFALEARGRTAPYCCQEGSAMKLNVEQDPALEDVEVRIRCPRVDTRVERIIAAAQAGDQKLAGFVDGFLRVVNPSEVLYAEYVDGRTFLYTTNAVLESNLSLNDIERDLADAGFIRGTRTMLVNLMHVTGLRPYLGARLELVLSNGEHLIASRQFAPLIKKRIGL